MASTAINTLRFAQRLKAAGVPERQAEEMAAALGEERVDNLATKADLKAEGAQLRTEIAALETRLTWRLLAGTALLLIIPVGFLKLA